MRDSAVGLALVKQAGVPEVGLVALRACRTKCARAPTGKVLRVIVIVIHCTSSPHRYYDFKLSTKLCLGMIQHVDVDGLPREAIRGSIQRAPHLHPLELIVLAPLYSLLRLAIVSTYLPRSSFTSATGSVLLIKVHDRYIEAAQKYWLNTPPRADESTQSRLLGKVA